MYETISGMTNSDIIAIVAIAASALSSIISAIVVISTTRINIQAKRSEIAFSERLRAFQEVYELISNVNSRLYLFQHTFKDQTYNKYLDYIRIQNDANESTINKALAEVVKRLVTIDSGFISTYNQQRVFIPPKIDREILKYYEEVLAPVSTTPIKELAQNVSQMKFLHDSHSEKILSEIHKFIGFS